MAQFSAVSTRKALISAALLASSFLPFSTFAVEKVASVEGISEYHLDNGLQVLLFPDPTKETVTLNVTYHVGSKHENYGETGMAHLLEHLVFKGTPRHKDIPAELSSHGARPNGTTWTDRTNYYETFAATEENINWALDMEADRMVNSFIAKEDLDSEMTVVRNEFEMGENSPFRVTLQRMMASAYEWHNYGKSTIGARADLENVPIDRLKAFYKKYYQPDNATVIVAGKFEEASMIKLVEQYFGPIPKPERELRPLYTAEPAQDGEKQITVRRVGDMQLVGAAYHVPAGSHPEFAALSVLASILGDSPTGRLHKALVEPHIASRTFGFNFQWQEPGVALYFAQADKAADINKVQAELLKVIESVKDQPISAEEVDRAKRNLIKNIELTFNSSQNIALGLSEWLGMGDWRLMFLNRDRIENVTVEQVQKAAEFYLVNNNRTVGRFIPTEKPERVDIPQVASVNDMVKNYKGREAVAQGEVFEPSHDNIDSRTKKLTLANGAKVALLAKKTRGESVIFRLALQMGNETSLAGKNVAGAVAGIMLMRGTERLTREQLQDEFDKLKANASIGGASQQFTASVETNKANIDKALALVKEVLTTPAFDEKEFEQLKNTMKVDIESQLQDPQALAFTEYSRRQNPYPKDHPRYVATFEEQLSALSALTLDDVKAFYKDFFGAANTQISVIGDFDEKAMQATLDKEFGSIANSNKYQRVANPYHKLVVKDQQFNTPDKENAVFVALTSIPVGENNPDAPAIELANYIFGGGFLNSRLATRLRQKDGLSYGAGSFVRMGDIEDRAAWGAYAICAPQNLDKVELGFKEELARLLKDGFTDEEIAAAKSGLLQGKKVSRSQDKELVGKLNNNLYLDQTMMADKQYEQVLNSLTAAKTHEILKKYLKVTDFSIIKAGDLSKIE